MATGRINQVNKRCEKNLSEIRYKPRSSLREVTSYHSYKVLPRDFYDRPPIYHDDLTLIWMLLNFELAILLSLYLASTVRQHEPSLTFVLS